MHRCKRVTGEQPFVGSKRCHCISLPGGSLNQRTSIPDGEVVLLVALGPV
jgi:hypothetical protein